MDKDFDFQITNVRDALSAFTRLISPTHKKVFSGIFDTLQTGDVYKRQHSELQQFPNEP